MLKSYWFPFIFLSSFIVAQTVKIGRNCAPDKDQYGCEGSNFIACDGATSRWILQNICTGPCLNDTAFVSQCFLNSQPQFPSVETSSVATSTSISTFAPTQTTESLAIKTPDSLISTAVLAIIISCVFLAILLFFVFFRKHFFKSLLWRRSESQENLVETPAGILQKLYIVVQPYTAVQEDEVSLSNGDQIELYLLYNDGWAKGFNITTGASGLIPVTHIEVVPVTGGRSSGSASLSSLIIPQTVRKPAIITI